MQNRAPSVGFAKRKVQTMLNAVIERSKMTEGERGGNTTTQPQGNPTKRLSLRESCQRKLTERALRQHLIALKG